MSHEDLQASGLLDNTAPGLKESEDGLMIAESQDFKTTPAVNKKDIDKALREKFRTDVDFHHKMAFSFEKSYRMSKKNIWKDKRGQLNLEIIE